MMAAEIVTCGLAVICLALSEVTADVAFWRGGWVQTGGGNHGRRRRDPLDAIKSLTSIRRCFALFQPDDTEIYGVNVTVANNPALWQWIRDVTRRAELTVPDNIVVGFLTASLSPPIPYKLKRANDLRGIRSTCR